MHKTVFITLIAAGLLTAAAFRTPEEKTTPARLGEMLFFDPILSEDYTISCASCHKPDFAFADTTAFSTGVHGRKTKRNTPSAMNMSDRGALFWDGRAATLEEQVLFPIVDFHEMNLPLDSAVRRLNESSRYKLLFDQVFGEKPGIKNMAAALAAFERTLETADTPNDRWLNDEPGGMTAQQLRGREVFRTKGKCIECHFSPDFTGDEFRSIGLFNGRQYNDSGRYLITRNPADIGSFKVPGLRNVAMTAPYMHDGSFATLMEVIHYYDNPHAILPDGQNRDSLLLMPLGLTIQEKEDLEMFLYALTDDRFIN